MASPSRPFQSQVMTRAVRLYHRLTATGERWLAYGRSLLSVWTQVALYPAYIALQGTRVGRRKVQVMTARWRDRFGLTSRYVRFFNSSTPPAADWGIQQILTALGTSSAATPAEGATPSHRSLARWGVADQAIALHLQHFSTDRSIQGIASCLTHRSFVLVDTDNQRVAGLSAQQQGAIAHLITHLMAAYAHWQRRQQRLHQLQAGPLPLPAASTQAWWPVRVGLGVMAWMQTGSVATTLNLFQEANVRYRLSSLPSPRLGRATDAAPRSRALPWQPDPLGRLQPANCDRPLGHPWQTVDGSLSPRLTALGASLVPRLTALASQLRLPPAQTSSEQIGPFQSSYWGGPPSRRWPLRLAQLVAPKGQLTARTALPLAAIAPPVREGTVGAAIAPSHAVAVSRSAHKAPSAAVSDPKPMAEPVTVPAVESADRVGPWINVEVLATEYLERPLRRLLRWLDQLLVGVEGGVQGVWQWGREQLWPWLQQTWQTAQQRWREQLWPWLQRTGRQMQQQWREQLWPWFQKTGRQMQQQWREQLWPWLQQTRRTAQQRWREQLWPGLQQAWQWSRQHCLEPLQQRLIGAAQQGWQWLRSRF